MRASEDDVSLENVLKLPQYKDFRPNVVKSVTPGPGRYLEPRVAYGVSIGCYAGVGAGISLGFGRIVNIRKDFALVLPSTMPFLHEGKLVGAYCGLAMGVGFGPGMCSGWGLSWPISRVGRIEKGFGWFDKRILSVPRKAIAQGFQRILSGVTGRPMPPVLQGA